MSDFKNEAEDNIASVVHEVALIVYEMAGIQLGPRQFMMVKSRLKTRMLRLGIESFSEYVTYLRQHQEQESQILLSLMTTHHSYFFREFSHFEFLLNKGLRNLIEAAQARPDKTIRIWSAACSRGQEVYSLAMFFDYHLKKLAPELSFEIWGTDVDAESVKFGENGVYRYDEVNQSPAMYVAGHWVRGKDNIIDFTKVKSHLKAKCHFETCNLLTPEEFLKDRKFDLIFCRNVYIYFSQDQIKKISAKIFNHLESHGYLVLGVSETLNGLGLKTDLVGPSTYQHKLDKLKPIVIEPKQKIIEVLCVDDSETIHALLGRILVPEHGFRLKAKAKDGREALEILKNQKFDVITLDLHMPRMDGVAFLQEYKQTDTPVVILSSIGRDDKSIAQRAIELGAIDYVEKPSLENISQAGNEIRSKLKMVSKNKIPSKGSGIVNVIPERKIKVLIVDDNETILQMLSHIVSKSNQFEIVGTVSRPSKVEELIKITKPDVITMDIHMPEMDGVTLLKKLMPIYKIPVVMINSSSAEDIPLVLRALEAGAIDYIQKPHMANMQDYSQLICDRLKTAASANMQPKKFIPKKTAQFSMDALKSNMVIIGASTGGTDAIRVVLEGLPSNIPPVLIVQHIPPIFSKAFAERLNSIMPFEVKEAEDGDEVMPNRVLIAPGGKQMAVRTAQNKTIVRIIDDPPMNRHKPSVDYFFRSVHRAQIKNVVAILLTGMGSDGAREMRVLRDQGARTIAQDKESSIVFGMPKEAIEMGAAEFTLSLSEIPAKIFTLCSHKKAA